MDKNNILVETNLVRLDSNFAENSLTWANSYGDDSTLCFDILLYIANNSQKDLFNYGFIDLNKFSNEMGYKKENLQRYVKLPYQKELEGKKTFEVFSRDKKYATVFENALYKLGRLNIPLTSMSFDEDKKEHILKTQFVQILKEINIHLSGSSTNSKMYYSYVTSEEFDYNLSRYFFLADFSLIKKLKEENLLLLYFYLKFIENSKHKQFIEKDFIKLCGLAQIEVNDEKVKDTKYKLKTRKLTKIKQYVNFDFTEVNVSGRYKYGFLFTFPKNLDLNKEEDRKILMQANSDYIDITVYKFYRKKYGSTLPIDSNEYKEWIFDKDKDYEKKLDIYFSCLAKLYKDKKSVMAHKYMNDAIYFFTRKNQA
jgi:hypothetical protein